MDVAMMSFAERIKTLRLERNLSQEEVGRLAGIKQCVVFQLEAGRTKSPRALTIIRFAKAFNTTTDEILDYQGGEDGSSALESN